MRGLWFGRTVFGVIVGTRRGWKEPQVRLLAATFMMALRRGSETVAPPATRWRRSHRLRGWALGTLSITLVVLTGDMAQTMSWVAYAGTGPGRAGAMSAALCVHHHQSCGVCPRTAGGHLTAVVRHVPFVPPSRLSTAGAGTSGPVLSCRFLPLAQCGSRHSRPRCSCQCTRPTSPPAVLGGALRRIPSCGLCRTCGRRPARLPSRRVPHCWTDGTAGLTATRATHPMRTVGIAGHNTTGYRSG